MSATVQLIVGLGNPGAEYEKTRHNVGAWLVDELAHQQSVTLHYDKKFLGAAGKAVIDSQPVWLFKPATYMNESGQAVSAIARFYKIAPEAILVAHDELDFPAGTIRIKQSGGHGGHNGLRDMIRHLSSHDFFRLRIGIGHPGDRSRVTGYVLGDPSRGDAEKIRQSIDEGIAAIPDLVAGKVQKAFKFLHSE